MRNRSPPSQAAKKRMLIIVNPVATTVSDRLRNLVVYALQGRYEVEAVSTEAQNHATEIGREVADHGYDIVVAFGGDGTLNEVANGLAGTDVPVSVLPGGSTNVVCRTLGMPNDVVDATEHLLTLADDWAPRKIDLGNVDERHFVFACGVGIDATVVERVDAHPKLKSRGRPLLLQLVRASRPSTASTSTTPSGCASRAAASRPRGSPRSSRTPTPSPTSPAARSGSARGSRSTTARSRSASEAGHPARHADLISPPLQRDQAGGAPPPGGALRRRRSPGRVGLDEDKVGSQALPAAGRRRLHRRPHPDAWPIPAP